MIAHVDHGKTTLSDALLSGAGLQSKTGSGTKRSLDTDAQEKERGITISATGVTLEYEGLPPVAYIDQRGGDVTTGRAAPAPSAALQSDKDGALSSEVKAVFKVLLRGVEMNDGAEPKGAEGSSDAGSSVSSKSQKRKKRRHRARAATAASISEDRPSSPESSSSTGSSSTGSEGGKHFGGGGALEGRAALALRGVEARQDGEWLRSELISLLELGPGQQGQEPLARLFNAATTAGGGGEDDEAARVDFGAVLASARIVSTLAESDEDEDPSGGGVTSGAASGAGASRSDRGVTSGLSAVVRYKKRGAASIEFRPRGARACAAAACVYVCLAQASRRGARPATTGGKPKSKGRVIVPQLPGDTARLQLARFCKARGWAAEYVLEPRVAVLVTRPSGLLTAHYDGGPERSAVVSKGEGKRKALRAAKEACAKQALVELRQCELSVEDQEEQPAAAGAGAGGDAGPVAAVNESAEAEAEDTGVSALAVPEAALPPAGDAVTDRMRLTLLDCPGHADFAAQVSAALRLCDGALLVVDAAEGPRAQTAVVLRAAVRQGVRPIVVVNKADRLQMALKLSSLEAARKANAVVAAVNKLLRAAAEPVIRAGG